MGNVQGLVDAAMNDFDRRLAEMGLLPEQPELPHVCVTECTPVRRMMGNAAMNDADDPHAALIKALDLVDAKYPGIKAEVLGQLELALKAQGYDPDDCSAC